jgi:hypothetical protein
MGNRARQYSGRYGWLTVVKMAGRKPGNPKSNMYWECLCDCGNTVCVTGPSLAKSRKTCGCYQGTGEFITPKQQAKKDASEKHKRYIEFRRKYRPEYRAWENMKSRCSNPNSTGYDSYGGRGISFCERWRVFESFVEDMGAKPSPKHSLDRIDVNGDYCPENCRWATPQEQSINKRNNRLLTLRGESMRIDEWADRLGVRANTIACRLHRGWNEEDALTKPVQKKKKL